MSEQMIALDISGLTKTYSSGHRAVDGLSLRVPVGSIFGFVGLNGAGKTTTIRIIAGLCDRDDGTVSVFGEELRGHDEAYKRRIGFVLDQPLYFEWMSASGYLQFVGTMYGLGEQDVGARTSELLDFFDLENKGDEPIASFSTGMKKKVSLAAAIIHKPQLIILDEPLEGIDALASNAIKQSLTLMASKGTTIFITSHVLDTVERLCTDVSIVHRGKTLLTCRTSEIRTLVRGALQEETYQSLEELFVDVVAEKVKTRHLSWL
jgi:ABC-2 type transport system ATP-binding protein